jgi:chemotaxis family two-component system response regulator Rcp1
MEKLKSFRNNGIYGFASPSNTETGLPTRYRVPREVHLMEPDIAQPVQFHILLVDDSEADAKIFEAALKQASPRVNLYWVATGKEAIDFLHQRGRFENIGSIRIVVLDLNLPQRDGFEILAEIKRDPETSSKPVVIFSSSDDGNEVSRAYSLDANVYFSKPMTLESYIEKLRVIAQHWLDLAELPK